MRLKVEAARVVVSDDRLDAVLCVLAGANFLRGGALRGCAGGCRSRWIWFRLDEGRDLTPALVP